MNTKFTKGSWLCDSTIVYVNDGPMIADCDHGTIEALEQEKANAQLISVAPDMYHALSEVENAIIKCRNEIELADTIASMSHDINLLLTKARGDHENS